jgi:hypothetical protein
MKFLDMPALFVFALIGGFHVLLFRTLNAAPVFERTLSQEPIPALRLELEDCVREDGKLRVSGWYSHPTDRKRRHATTLVLRDDATGRMYIIDTDLLRNGRWIDPPAKPGQHGETVPTGFTGSLNLRWSHLQIAKAQVLLAYDHDGTYFLKPTGCVVP